MTTYKISADFRLALPVGFVAALSAIWLILNILPIPVEGQLEPEWLNPVVATILLIPSGILAFKMSRCSLTLNEDGLVFTPLFGAVRHLTYGDIQKISIGGKTYKIYTADGKTLIRFDDTYNSNASEIVTFLKSKGVKAEL